jgi:hypothetical protein
MPNCVFALHLASRVHHHLRRKGDRGVGPTDTEEFVALKVDFYGPKFKLVVDCDGCVCTGKPKQSGEPNSVRAGTDVTQRCETHMEPVDGACSNRSGRQHSLGSCSAEGGVFSDSDSSCLGLEDLDLKEYLAQFDATRADLFAFFSVVATSFSSFDRLNLRMSASAFVECQQLARLGSL